MAKTKEEYLADFKKWGLLGGRPRAFKSPRHLAEQMAAFLESAENRMVDVVTKTGVVQANVPLPLSEDEFCSFCGITKTTFHAYAKKPEFAPLIDFYKTKAEAYWVRQCGDGKPGNKADFILKNAFGGNWKEESSVNMNVTQALVEFAGSTAGDKGMDCLAVDAPPAEEKTASDSFFEEKQ